MTENPKEHPKVPMVPKVPKVRTRVKPRKLVYLILENRNQRQVQQLRKLHNRITLTILTRTILGFMMAGVMMNEIMTGEEERREWVEEEERFSWQCAARSIVRRFLSSSFQVLEGCSILRRTQRASARNGLTSA